MAVWGGQNTLRPYGWRWRFAYLPTLMDNSLWVWWERYRSRRVDTGHLWTEMTTQRHLTEQEDW